jgi:hypothetical protein
VKEELKTRLHFIVVGLEVEIMEDLTLGSGCTGRSRFIRTELMDDKRAVLMKRSTT